MIVGDHVQRAAFARLDGVRTAMNSGVVAYATVDAAGARGRRALTWDVVVRGANDALLPRERPDHHEADFDAHEKDPAGNELLPHEKRVHAGTLAGERGNSRAARAAARICLERCHLPIWRRRANRSR
jgi:hypothetical protein